MTRPNVILVTVDALRRDRLGCYGSTAGLTPNLDRLAAQGIRFSQAVTGGSWTQAAFPTILTSTYASMYGGCLGPLSPQRPSPVAALQEAGYTTIGITSNPLIGRRLGYQRGFGHFHDLEPGEREPFLRSRKGGQFLLRQPVTHHLARLGGLNLRPARVYAGARQVNRAVLQAVQQAPAPVFLWAHYMDVHWPYHLEDQLQSPGEIARAWQDVAQFHRASWGGGQIPAVQRARFIELYEQALSFLDAQIGELIAGLERAGLLDHSLLILLADHGEEFCEHGRWGHLEVNLFEELIRIPWLLRISESLRAVLSLGPGIGTAPGPATVEAPVHTLDLMPTILDACGVAPLAGTLGQSLFSAAWRRRDFEVCERWRPPESMIALREPGFKYIWRQDRPHEEMLFDLHQDAAERENVIERHADVAERMRLRLRAHLERVGQSDSAPALSEPDLDESLAARLRALGYLE